MNPAARFAPELHRAMAEHAIIAAAPIALPGLPGARLRAVLALDGDLLLAIETGAPEGAPHLSASALGGLLAQQGAALEAAAAALFAALAAREQALAAELRRLSRWLSLPERAVLLAAFTPTLHDLATGVALAAHDYVIGTARALLLAALARAVLRWLVRRAGRRLLGLIS